MVESNGQSKANLFNQVRKAREAVKEASTAEYPYLTLIRFHILNYLHSVSQDLIAVERSNPLIKNQPSHLKLSDTRKNRIIDFIMQKSSGMITKLENTSQLLQLLNMIDEDIICTPLKLSVLPYQKLIQSLMLFEEKEVIIYPHIDGPVLKILSAKNQIDAFSEMQNVRFWDIFVNLESPYAKVIDVFRISQKLVHYSIQSKVMPHGHCENQYLQQLFQILVERVKNCNSKFLSQKVSILSKDIFQREVPLIIIEYFHQDQTSATRKYPKESAPREVKCVITTQVEDRSQQQIKPKLQEEMVQLNEAPFMKSFVNSQQMLNTIRAQLKNFNDEVALNDDIKLKNYYGNTIVEFSDYTLKYKLQPAQKLSMFPGTRVMIGKSEMVVLENLSHNELNYSKKIINIPVRYNAQNFNKTIASSKIPKLKILFVTGPAKGEKFLLESIMNNRRQTEDYDIASISEPDNSCISIIDIPNNHPIFENQKSPGMKYFQISVNKEPTCIVLGFEQSYGWTLQLMNLSQSPGKQMKNVRLSSWIENDSSSQKNEVFWMMRNQGISKNDSSQFKLLRGTYFIQEKEFKIDY